LNVIETEKLNDWFPTEPMMGIGEKWGDTWRAGVHAGISHVYHFYTRRNLTAFSKLYSQDLSAIGKCALLGGNTVGLRTARFLPQRWINKDTGPMKPHTAGTLYVPLLNGEQNWLNIFASRAEVTHRAIVAASLVLRDAFLFVAPAPRNRASGRTRERLVAIDSEA
jgi:hypothetical protein